MMAKSTLFSAILGALFVVGLAIAPAQAQATRTWVSGVGDDANPCSRTAPCKTWAGSIAKTATGGEIDALDPGGFGALTITKPITLDGGGGQVASTLTSGTPGFTISFATAGAVILRNIRVNGLLNSGSPGTIGVNIVGGSAGVTQSVIIEKCDIFGFGTLAVSAAPSAGTLNLKIQETTANNNAGGVLIKPTGGAVVNGSIERAHIDANVAGGVKVDGTGGGTSNVAITDSSLSLNGANGLNAVSGTSNVNVDLTRVVLANNGQSGVVSNNSSGGTSTVTVGSSILSYNAVGAWSIVGTGVLLSFKNNQVTGPTGSVPGMATFQ
jgi:hypothetical protein